MSSSTGGNPRPRLVIIGGGFGGLSAATALHGFPGDITIIDRKNHHTFQPLLYQVATAGLSPGEIAAPIRGILGKQKNVRVLLGEVTGFDLERRKVNVSGIEVGYDYLIVAAGATHSYFGHDQWAPLAPGLKTIEDALEIRRRVLLAFEIAERQETVTGTHQPVHFVVVGAGPTGVELAGTLAEIANRSIPRDFRATNPRETHIILVEGAPRVLPGYPEDLSRSAERQLRRLGVDVRTSAMVSAVEPGRIQIGDQYIPSTVTLWAAGVAASPLGRLLGAATDRAGRVEVEPDLSIPGHPEVFVIGDLASFRHTADGKPVPGVAPAAMQEGRWVAANILRDLRNKPRVPFRYRDKGTLATIGRAAAVANFGKLHLSGFLAWLTWLFVHLMYLVGFRNRVLVFIEWAWSYFTYQRSARLITGNCELPGQEQLTPAQPREPEKPLAAD
ncbi:MAG TPA: NAD(P)/FAD-dependent oxidoreductase [Terriglobales bacterium]|nr:NAD(P)/FAD-dependent oxidoreductase [Terriglobales bacterium]